MQITERMEEELKSLIIDIQGMLRPRSAGASLVREEASRIERDVLHRVKEEVDLSVRDQVERETAKLNKDLMLKANMKDMFQLLDTKADILI